MKKALEDAQVKILMLETEIEVAERINGILKHEFNLKDSFKNFDAAFKAVRSTIAVYNGYRLYNSLQYKTLDTVYKSKMVA